jgi:hypothetical protein
VPEDDSSPPAGTFAATAPKTGPVPSASSRHAAANNAPLFKLENGELVAATVNAAVQRFNS